MRWVFPVLYLAVAIIAILCMPKYEEAGMKVFENPEDVSNSFFYFGLILLFTAFILVVARKSEKFLKFLMYSLVFISTYYVLVPFIGLLSIVPSTVIVTLLIKKPNWIVINASALLLAGGVTSMFGISLEPLPVIVLLIILAVYNAVSVYKTDTW